jgi:hypothetical protein
VTVTSWWTGEQEASAEEETGTGEMTEIFTITEMATDSSTDGVRAMR